MQTQSRPNAVHFVERNPRKAAVAAEALDRLLARDQLRLVDMGVQPIVLTTIKAIENLAPVLRTAEDDARKSLLTVTTELRRLLDGKETRGHQIIVTSRKLAEVIVHLVGAEATKNDGVLASGIRRIAEHNNLGVSPWIASYLDVLRTLGNAEAHIASPKNAVCRPGRIVATDVSICLSCISRLLEFAREWIR